jgi:hypothetical protein
MDDAEALELIDAHLDREPVTEEQAQALAVWLRDNPEHADRAFHRIFLHSFLQQRLQVEPALPPSTVARNELISLNDPLALDGPPHSGAKSRWRMLGIGFLIAGLVAFGAFLAFMRPGAPATDLWVYEGFDYPPTSLTAPLNASNPWPEQGGLDGLDGGQGWAEPWKEKGEKVSVLVSDVSANTYRAGDMRQFGPLGFADSHGHVLKSSGIQLRSAARPASMTTRSIDATRFPHSFSDELGLGRDGAVLWISFLAQSFDGRGQGTFAFLQLGTDAVGLRLGKLTSARSGEWSGAAVLEDVERNVRSSGISSGQAILFVARITFRPGGEHADVWIDPPLDQEPVSETATMKIPLPDFRVKQLSINSRYTTDFDEIRMGGSFRDVTPVR